jgi:hypothetical protein
VCNEEKAVKVHHSSIIMSNIKWVFTHMWLVIYVKFEYGSKRTAMSTVCAVVCKI